MWTRLKSFVSSATHRRLAAALVRHVWTNTKKAVKLHTEELLVAAGALVALAGTTVGTTMFVANQDVNVLVELAVGSIISLLYTLLALLAVSTAAFVVRKAFRWVKSQWQQRRARRFDTGDTNATAALRWLHTHGHISTTEARTTAQQLLTSEDRRSRQQTITALQRWYETELTGLRQTQDNTNLQWLRTHMHDIVEHTAEVTCYLQGAHNSGVEPVDIDMDLTAAARVALDSDNRRLIDAVTFLLATADNFELHAGHDWRNSCGYGCALCSRTQRTTELRQHLQTLVLQAAQHVAAPDRQLQTMADRFDRRATHAAQRQQATAEATNDVTEADNADTGVAVG